MTTNLNELQFIRILNVHKTFGDTLEIGLQQVEDERAGQMSKEIAGAILSKFYKDDSEQEITVEVQAGRTLLIIDGTIQVYWRQVSPPEEQTGFAGEYEPESVHFNGMITAWDKDSGYPLPYKFDIDKIEDQIFNKLC
jgi:hypothetical protein